MPSYRQYKHPNKPWAARAHRIINGIDHEWSLGYYATKEEAWEAEQAFDIDVAPRRYQQYGVHQRSLMDA